MKIQSNLIKNILAFAFAFVSFAASASADGCGSAVPKSVGSVGSETNEGNGYWEPGWFPLTGDKACEEAQDGRGVRYRNATLRSAVTIKNLMGEWNSWIFINKYKANADHYVETLSHWDNFSNRWYGPDSTDRPYSQNPDWQSMFQHPDSYWTQYKYELNKARSSAKLPYWENSPEHYGSGTDYTLSGAFGITITNPTTSRNAYYSSVKYPDGRWRATTITGRISDCPGKYKVILYYTETPGGGIKSIEDEFEFEGSMPKDGYLVSMPLPTTECKQTNYVRMEYVGVDSCSDVPPPPGGGGSGNDSVMSITHLGRKRDGGNAGSLYLHKPSVTEEVFSPVSLEYLTPAGSGADAVIRSADGALRQLRMPEFLVDITLVTVAATPAPVVSGYQIDFYPLSMVEDQVDSATGVYLLKSGASPSYTKRHENPDAPSVSNASATRLRITSQYAGGSPQVDLFENVAGGVSLSLANGLKRVVKTTSVAGSDTTTTKQIFSPATATVPDLVFSTVTRAYSFGNRVVEESQGTGAARVWTSYTYDDTANSATYGLLKLRQSSTGSWERHDYYSNGDLRYTWSPLADADSSTTNTALLRCVEQVKTSVSGHPVYGNGELLTTIESQGGVEIARSHRFTCAEPETIFIGADDTVGVWVKHKIESQAVTPGANQAWDGAGNLLTHSYYALAGEGVNEILRQDKPDGTITLVGHSGDTSVGNNRVEKWEGQPNAEKTDIVAGTRKVTERTAENLVISETVRDVATESGGVRNSGLVISEEQYSNHDVVGRPKTIVYLDGSTETRNYSTCCGKLTSSSRNGVTTNYGYDALGRLAWEAVSTGEASTLATQSETRYTYNAGDQVRTKERRAYVDGVSGALQLIARNDYDNSGAPTATATPGSLASDATLTRVVGYQSSYNALDGRTTKTATKPDGATEISISHRSGAPYSRTGTGAFPVRYEYGTATLPDAAQWGLSTSTPLPFTKEIKLTASGGDTSETVTTYSDFLGRAIKTVYPDGAAIRSFYNAKGQLARQVDADGVQMLYTYNDLGERLLSVLDLNRNGLVDLTGTDRVTQTVTSIGTRGAIPVQRSTTLVWASDNVDGASEISRAETALDGLQAWQTSQGQTTHTIVAYNSAAGTRTETITSPDQTQTVRVYLASQLKAETRKNSAGTAIAETLYRYDGYGRVQVASNLQAPGSALPAPNSPLVTTYTYYADDQVASVLTPDPDLTRSGTGYDPQLTSYHYDAAGRVDDVTQPDNTHAYTSYWPTGRVKRAWGSRTYPSEYAYDAQGRVKTLTTWQNFSAPSGAAVTTWNYHPQRGWLSSKTYAGGVAGPNYTYWPSGRLNTRVWARGITTTYTYNNAGDLWTVVYSASAAPTVTTLYDRLGRQKTVTDAAGTLTRTYDRGLLDDESYVGGLLAGRTLTRGLETNTGAVTAARPGTLGATALSTLTYGYDNAGRLQTIAEASGPAATMGYKPVVGVLQSITVASAGATRLASNRVVDQLGRVASVDFDNPAPGLLAARAYTYNGANQRVQVEHEDTRRWAYGYDALGQVNLAEKRQSNNSVLPGYAYAFDYDDIGNRETATANGRVSNYSSDASNRYLARGTPLWADVRGKALSTASVLVNDELATRTGDDFYLAVPVTGSKENALKIQAARPSPEQAVTENRSVLVPAVPENFVYDADGNLTQDGLWSYEWDGENRLKAQELRSDVAATTWKRLEYAYDGQSRRIQKVVKTKAAAGGAWTDLSDTRFLYDGWNLLAEYAFSSGTFSLARSHAWGSDLSGSAQGAGGVGGLLWTKVAATAKTYAAGSDANGNVVVYVDCADGAVVGRRDYGAFGEAVLTTGVAGALPFGFSTKFEEKETGLYYYGFRYYNPSTGRWLSRDPIEEGDGPNMYAFARNNALAYIDPDGRAATQINGGTGADPYFTTQDAKTGLEVTYINKCNIVIFIGHNTTVPQNKIVTPPCSASQVYSCGGGAGGNPALPPKTIPGATAGPGPSSTTLLPVAEAERLALDAFARAEANLTAECARGRLCCNEIKITIECRLNAAERQLMGGGTCGRERVFRCGGGGGGP